MDSTIIHNQKEEDRWIKSNELKSHSLSKANMDTFNVPGYKNNNNNRCLKITSV
jgi:hypothetical protein